MTNQEPEKSLSKPTKARAPRKSPRKSTRKSSRKSNLVRSAPLWERISIFAFGVLFVGSLLVLAVVFPKPSEYQYTVFRIILALASAGVFALIPGFLEIQYPNLVRAGGAPGVFVLTLFYSPAALVTTPVLVVNAKAVQMGEHNTQNNYFGLNDAAVAKQLGVAEAAVGNLFKELKEQKVPVEEWDQRLRQFVERYKDLQRQVSLLSAEDPAVSKLQQQARLAIDAADFKQAEQLLQQAVGIDDAAAEKSQQVYRQRKRSAAASQALDGKSKHTRFALTAAIASYEKAVRLAVEAKDEALVAEYRASLASVFNENGSHHQAIALYEQALRYYEQHGTESAKASIWNNLGTAWDQLGEYRKAIDYYEKALARRLRTYDDKHPDVAQSWHNLSAVWNSLGEYRKSIDYSEKALASNLNSYGDKHPDVARRWNSLGAAWYSLGNTARP